MEDDLEEELLAVAGRSRPAKRKAAASSDEDYEDEAATRSRRKAPSARRRQPAPQEEEEEDLDSDFDDGYGSDLMADEADRLRLAGMTELEREMELADRAERRDKELERRRTARILKQQQQHEAAKAGGMRSSTRQRGVDSAKKSAMAELVAAKHARARKTSREEAKQRRREAAEEESEESEYEVSDRSDAGGSEQGELPAAAVERRRSPEDPSDAEPEREEDEEEEEEGWVTTQTHGDEESEDAEYRAIKEMQVRRFTLEKWQAEPFFERTLPGAVVRVAVGSGRYFMAQVVHVEEREPGLYKDPGIFRLESPYEFPEKGGKTSKWLYVQRGTSPRLMPMTLVSNHGITEDEFRSWRQQCEKDNRPQISTAEVEEVRQRLRDAATYVYTAEDVAQMVESRRNRGQVSNLAKERSRLELQRAKALEDEQTEEVERLDAALAELEARAAAKAARERREAEDGRKTLAQVNKANALRNMENALRNVTARPDGSRALAAGGVDPFSRRQTRPMNYWSTGRRAGQQDAAAGEEGGGADAAQQAAGDAAAGGPAATATENEAGGIELNIDLGVLQQSPAAALLRRRLLGPNWAAGLPTRQDFAGRKTLTLNDYKRRQGIV